MVAAEEEEEVARTPRLVCMAAAEAAAGRASPPEGRDMRTEETAEALGTTERAVVSLPPEGAGRGVRAAAAQEGQAEILAPQEIAEGLQLLMAVAVAVPLVSLLTVSAT